MTAVLQTSQSRSTEVQARDRGPDAAVPAPNAAALAALDREIDALDQVMRSYGAVPEYRRMHATFAAMERICVLLDECGLDRTAALEPLLHRLKQLAARSPFAWRVQVWPRGYAGDFETIELISDGRLLCGPENPAYWIEWWALRGAIGEQHRNRLRFQRRQTFSGLHDGASILSVACGGARDWRDPCGTQRGLRATLIDIDPAALKLAAERCVWISRVDCVNKNALAGLRAVRKQKFDRIQFGGLFDYLDDRAVVLCLRMALNMLREDGRIIFTNLAREAHPELLLGSFADWPVRSRSADDVAQLVVAATSCLGTLSIMRDRTDLAHLCRVVRTT